ncbi:hypothetical protein ACLI09_08940 [Flavobacterium sp. RHBU_24]|uniref:hypothetical protein n=1 Tax=Flavobacterium sp. RHBU_24 TaxID=3391185 RepID=UPI003984DEBB
MRNSIRLFVFAAILFILSLFLIITALTKLSVSTEVYEATIEKAENDDLSKYDYFKLTDAYILPYAGIYEIEEINKTVTEIVYPVVSAAYLEKARNAYRKTHNNEFDEDGFNEWFEDYKVKPKFYVKANVPNMSESRMIDMLLADSVSKNIEGLRITSFIDMSDNISSGYKEMGITTENAVFINEGVNPFKAKEDAKIGLVPGCVFLLVSLILFFLGKSNIKKEKKRQQLIDMYSSNPQTR